MARHQEELARRQEVARTDLESAIFAALMDAATKTSSRPDVASIVNHINQTKTVTTLNPKIKQGRALQNT